MHLAHRECPLAFLHRPCARSYDERFCMSRCAACNCSAFVRLSPKEAAQPLVPRHVYDVVDEFWRCGGCGKVFWVGPKSHSAQRLVERLVGSGALRGSGSGGDAAARSGAEAAAAKAVEWGEAAD